MNHDFQFISKHSPEVKDAYRNIQQILNLVHNDLAGHYTFQAKAVGSYSRNMITKNIKGNTGFDFDFNSSPNDPENSLSPKEIKLLFKESLDKFAQRYGYDYAEDSTRVLTIKVKDMKNARILHGADFAFVNDYEDDNGNLRQEYIRFDKRHNSYFWEKQPREFYMLPQRIDWLKENGFWNKTRNVYLNKKNKNTNPYKHSRSLFTEAVNETYKKFAGLPAPKAASPAAAANQFTLFEMFL